MSKLYLKYLEKKNENSEIYYLFKSGMFYIFIDEDAKKISKITPLSTTFLTSDIVKCGFPKNSFNKYMEVFKNLGLEVNVVEVEKSESCNNNKILSKIKNIK